MTREEKLQVHLEMVIWRAVPEGTVLNARQIEALMAAATPEQKAAAYYRGLHHVPFLLDDERTGGW